jgi:hypothetical protein
MSIAVKLDPGLWARVKQKWTKSAKGGVAGKWNARKAMLAVAEYKKRGGRYAGRRAPHNSLKKWERENWGYVSWDRSGRYLPAAVRRALTPAERRRENALKRGHAGEWIPYSASVREKMRRHRIWTRGKTRTRAAAAAAPRKRATAATAAAAAPRRRATAAARATRKRATAAAPRRRATAAARATRKRATAAAAAAAPRRRATPWKRAAPAARKRAAPAPRKRATASARAPRKRATAAAAPRKRATPAAAPRKSPR